MYVRKSVANNLNDISKTHPDLVVNIAHEWYGKNKDTDWIIKHGCRTLLKKGNRDILTLFGYEDDTSVNIHHFMLEKSVIGIGEKLLFSFVMATKQAVKVRIEYGIDYVKANGKRSRKIFKISEISIKEKKEKIYTREHSFANTSVRKHYPGKHSIVLIINGIERESLDFQLHI